MRGVVACGLCVTLILCSSGVGYGGDSGQWEPLGDEAALRKVFLEKASLKDPASVQFRGVKLSRFKTPDGKPASIWCGEMNAKNSFGGYVGFSQFFAYDLGGDKQAVQLDSKLSHEGFVIVKDTYCKGSGM